MVLSNTNLGLSACWVAMPSFPIASKSPNFFFADSRESNSVTKPSSISFWISFSKVSSSVSADFQLLSKDQNSFDPRSCSSRRSPVQICDQSCCNNSQHQFIAEIINDIEIFVQLNIERSDTRYAWIQNRLCQRKIWSWKISQKNLCLGVGIKFGNSTNLDTSSRDWRFGSSATFSWTMKGLSNSFVSSSGSPETEGCRDIGRSESSLTSWGTIWSTGSSNCWFESVGASWEICWCVGRSVKIDAFNL